MVPHPIGQVVTGAGLIASLRGEVENNISAEQFLSATCIGRIRVEYLASLILVEDANAGKFIDRGVDQPVLEPPTALLDEDAFRDLIMKNSDA